MTLDLDDLTQGWDRPSGDIVARTVTGRDGRELIQMRVELGVMQMFPDGRPDAAGYRGRPTARQFVEHELRVRSRVNAQDWQELERELLQLNYRRLALTNLVDQALQHGDETAARQHLRRALRDIAECQQILLLFERNGVRGGGGAGLRSTLAFQHARLDAQLLVIERQYEEAIDRLEEGAAALDAQRSEAREGESDPDDADAGPQFLRELSRGLRREYDIPETLNEQLKRALADENFELAARLRDQLRKRQQARAAAATRPRGTKPV